MQRGISSSASLRDTASPPAITIPRQGRADHTVGFSAKDAPDSVTVRAASAPSSIFIEPQRATRCTSDLDNASALVKVNETQETSAETQMAVPDAPSRKLSANAGVYAAD